MAETTGSLRLVALVVLVIATILSQASALHAQVGETEADRTEALEQAGVEAEGIRAQPDPETGFPTGYWIEFGDGKDWLRLTSGEWLRGNLNWMRDGDFEFDGDKTNLIRKGWSNVDQLHSPKIKTYVFKRRVYATGRAMITKDKVIVETDEGMRTFPRSALLSILQGGTRERDWWAFEVGAGFTGHSATRTRALSQPNSGWVAMISGHPRCSSTKARLALRTESQMSAGTLVRWAWRSLFQTGST